MAVIQVKSNERLKSYSRKTVSSPWLETMQSDPHYLGNQKLLAHKWEP